MVKGYLILQPQIMRIVLVIVWFTPRTEHADDDDVYSSSAKESKPNTYL